MTPRRSRATDQHADKKRAMRRAARHRKEQQRAEENSAELQRFIQRGARLQNVFPELFTQDSDRAAVLVAVAMIDNALHAMFEKVFTISSSATPSERTFLLGRPPAPLGSASIKMRLAFALGFIKRGPADAIAYALKCRNEFAHSEVAPPLTQEMADSLFSKLKLDHDLTTLPEQFQSYLPSPPTARTKFICCCITLWGYIEAETYALEAAAKAGYFLGSPSQ